MNPLYPVKTEKVQPAPKPEPQQGPDEPCRCGSRIPYKRCHGNPGRNAPSFKSFMPKRK